MTTDNSASKDVYAIKVEVQTMSRLMERLSENIDKLTELSNNVSQVLAVQTSRLNQQEKTIENIISTADKNNKEIDREISGSHKELLQEIKEMKESMHKTISEQRNKIDQIERWTWIVSGGAAVVGFIISKLFSVVLKI